MQTAKVTVLMAAVTLAAATGAEAKGAKMSVHSALGCALMERLVAERQGANAVVSPVSVELVLTVLAAGAAGKTRQSLHESLTRFGIDPSNQGPAVSTPRAVFATALWKRPSIAIEPAFVARLASSQPLTVHDFAQEDAAAQVNHWASEVSRGRIPRIVDSVPPSLRVLIAGAADFKARWAIPFSPSATKPARFESRDGSSQSIPTMNLIAGLTYIDEARFKAVSLNYEGGTEVMEFVLPNEGMDAGGALRAALSVPQVSKSGNVRLSVPKFALAVDFDLRPALEPLGFASLFGATADYGAMTRGPMVLDRIRHAAFLRIDEDGTEAAAVTTAALIGSAAPTSPDFELQLNRPFFAIVRSTVDGRPLFIAYVARP